MKIVGIILLVILALILFVILAFLFVPVHYYVEASAHNEEYMLKTKATWLLHILYIYAEYDGEWHTRYRLPWVNNMTLKKSEDDEEEVTEESDVSVDAAEKTNEASVEADNDLTEQNTLEAKRRKPQKPKFKQKWKEFKGKLKEIRHNYRKYKRMLTDERNKAAVQHIKKELIRLLKEISPKKMKLDATFSTGSPDTTGQALGVLACFPITYHKRWNIVPDFEADHFYIEGDTKFSGRVSSIKFIGIIVRLWRDRNYRRLYRQIFR